MLPLSDGAVATPPSGTSRDFTSPQTYTVVSGDSTATNIYTVTASQGAVPSVFTWAGGVAGDWSDATKWTNDLATGTEPGYYGGPFYTLNFTAGGTYTVTHDQYNGFQVNELNFAATVTLDNPAGINGLTLVADNATLPEVNQNSGNQVSVRVPLELDATTTFGGTGGGWVKVQRPVSGSGGLTKDGPSTVSLEVDNSYTGDTVVNSGTLWAGANLTTPYGTGTVTLNGGRLYLNRAYPANPLVVNGGDIWASNGFGNEWKGPVTLNADLPVTPQYRIVFSGAISGSGGLTVNHHSNNNQVDLKGANDYTGDTTVNGSKLVVNGDSIDDAGKLTIDGGTVEPKGTEVVGSLFFGAVQQDAGKTYGATGSSADVIDDTRFSGSAGVVEVIAAPPSGTIVLIR